MLYLSKYMKYTVRQIVWITILAVGLIALVMVSGGMAGWVAANQVIDDRIVSEGGFDLPNTTTTKDEKDMITTSTIRLVPLSMLDAETRLVPESIFNRSSSVGFLYARVGSGNAMLRQEELMARAVAMTSDGWFAIPYEAVASVVNINWYIWHDGEIFAVEQKIIDQATDIVFAKVDAVGLPVASFAQSTAKKTGISVWLESGPEQYIPSTIAATRQNVYGKARLSDELDRRLVATGELLDGENGAPLWDGKGSLVGIAESNEANRINVIPGSVISASLQSLISNGEIVHAELGVMTIPVSLARILDTEFVLPERGAWIYTGSANIPAVVSNSSADEAGLLEGDVILQVDRDIIDASVDLGDIILQFVPGAEVTLRVWRDGEEIELPVTLGSRVTSREF